jgi:hypothetical protein
MQLAVTIKSDEELADLTALIEAVRRILSTESVTVLEAPKHLSYPYPFPVVTISEGPNRGRHFGPEAIDLLRSISRSNVRP